MLQNRFNYWAVSQVTHVIRLHVRHTAKSALSVFTVAIKVAKIVKIKRMFTLNKAIVDIRLRPRCTIVPRLNSPVTLYASLT